MTRLTVLLRDYQGATGLRLSHGERRDFISGLAGRDLAAATDLTTVEASQVIDRLDELVVGAQAMREGPDDGGPVDAEIVEVVEPGEVDS
jgi:hypothetical protein